MTIRVGLNGVGRIGRNLWRLIHSTAPDLAVVAANDLADAATVAHLLRYDSLRGRFPAPVDHTRRGLVVAGRPVPLTHHPSPDRIDWAAHRVDLVLEATGAFTRGPAVRGHLRGGAPRVLVSAPAPEADVCVMMGVNDDGYDPARHRVVASSCCTTYCFGAMLAPLHQGYGVETGAVTIAYSHGSRPGLLLDDLAPDLRGRRMIRANGTAIVPANVPGVRYGLDRVLPELAGRIAALALRVPVRAASAATLTVRLASPATAAAVNQTLEAAATSLLKGYLEVSHAPLVSADVIGSPASCVVDAGLTAVVGDLVRVVGWHDNEWGYAHRLIDLIRVLHPPTLAPCPGTGDRGGTGPR